MARLIAATAPESSQGRPSNSGSLAIFRAMRRASSLNLDKLVQPEATEQPDPKGYNDFLQGSIQILDILLLGIDLPSLRFVVPFHAPPSLQAHYPASGLPAPAGGIAPCPPIFLAAGHGRSPFRVRPGPLGEPKRGVGRLALETGAPVVPVAVIGSEASRRGWRIRPHKVRVRCGRALTFPRVESPSPALAGAPLICYVVLLRPLAGRQSHPQFFATDDDTYATALMFLAERYQRFLAANGIEIAGIEFITDANGEMYTYDVNTNTNYNAAAESAAGVYGMRSIAAYLGSELKKLERSKFGTQAAA